MESLLSEWQLPTTAEVKPAPLDPAEQQKRLEEFGARMSGWQNREREYWLAQAEESWVSEAVAEKCERFLKRLLRLSDRCPMPVSLYDEIVDLLKELEIARGGRCPD